MKKLDLTIKGRVTWLFTKYQIISKLIVSLIVFPVFNLITKLLIHLSGRTNISSGDYLGFIFSIYGIPVIILGIFVLTLVLGFDLNSFIIISSEIEENKKNIKIRDIVKKALKSVKYFFSPIGIFLVLFISFILPIIGFAINLGPLKSFKIPNFITSVIFTNTLYYILYIIVLAVFFILSIIYIFTLHFVILKNKKIIQAMKSSRKLILKNIKKFIIDYFVNILIILVYCLALMIVITLLLLFVSYFLGFVYANINVNVISIVLSIYELFTYFAFISVPIIVLVITKLFYKYNNLVIVKENKKQKMKTKTKIEISVLVFVVIVFNFTLAIFSENYFDQLFKTNIDIQIIAHRAGGDLSGENTIDGIKKAIQEGCSFTEIDVQRTKDNSYVINHDKTFNRLCNVNKTPMQMNLEEIKKLRIDNKYKIPTLEEVLDASKDKIGVFVELKEKSADEKMVDDVVKMIKAKHMLNQCVILSLDYNIIDYTTRVYPEVKTGFLYFFSFGSLSSLKGDYLIMEENQATEENIEQIHSSGKKAIVWTVNTKESINRFIYSNADGIITDKVEDVKKAIKEANNRNHLEIILDSFLIN